MWLLFFLLLPIPIETLVLWPGLYVCQCSTGCKIPHVLRGEKKLLVPIAASICLKAWWKWPLRSQMPCSLQNLHISAFHLTLGQTDHSFPLAVPQIIPLRDSCASSFLPIDGAVGFHSLHPFHFALCISERLHCKRGRFAAFALFWRFYYRKRKRGKNLFRRE